MKFTLPSFWKQIFTLLTGSATTQTFLLLAMPLNTHLHFPQNVDTFRFCVISITALITTIQLETAMILDYRKAEQQACLSSMAYAAIFLALLIAVTALIGDAVGIPQVLVFLFLRN